MVLYTMEAILVWKICLHLQYGSKICQVSIHFKGIPSFYFFHHYLQGSQLLLHVFPKEIIFIPFRVDTFQKG